MRNKANCSGERRRKAMVDMPQDEIHVQKTRHYGRMSRAAGILLVLMGVLISHPVWAAESDEDLAKKTLNPVADLISVPLQYNQDYGIGTVDATKSYLNIQPVIPVGMNKDWNIIIRTIIPVIDMESAGPGLKDTSGLGDTTQSFFFSPKQPIDEWIVGAGPVFLYPTASQRELGSGKWGIGPTFVVLRQEKGFTYGILANQIWSFAGNSNRQDVNATFLQPFFSYTTKTYTSLTINTESTYDWENTQWTVPLNFMVSQLLKIGGQPLNLQLGYRYYAEAPTNGPDWGIRFNLVFLFPK
jgi:hypothetical protein